MKKYQSTRNQKDFAEVIEVNGGQVTICITREDGSQVTKEISDKTLKRWWKPVAEQEEENMSIESTPEPEMIPMPGTEDPNWGEKAAGKVASSQVAEKKERKQRQKPIALEDCEAAKVITEFCDANCCTYDAGKVVGFRSLKVDGKIFAAFTFSNKGIGLWCKSKVISSITPDFTCTNHCYDARFSFTKVGEHEKLLIIKLLEAQLANQVETMNAQVSRHEAKAASKAAYAEKLEKAAAKRAEKEARKAEREAKKAAKEAEQQ